MQTTLAPPPLSAAASAQLGLGRRRGRLSLHGRFLNYLLWFGGLFFIAISGSIISQLEDNYSQSASTFLVIFSSVYTLLFFPVLSYVTFYWFFTRTHVELSLPSVVNSATASPPAAGTVSFAASFGDFLKGYYFSLGILIITLGIGFPYYVYQQKAWFFNNAKVHFPAGYTARVVLAQQFRRYFMKSWSIILGLVLLFIVLPFLSLDLLMFDGILMGDTGVAIFGIVMGMLLIFYYFYWSLKWMLTHTRLVFMAPAAPSPTAAVLPPAQRFVFGGDFTMFCFYSFLFFCAAILTVGLALIPYGYWLGRYFINHTEIIPSPRQQPAAI